MRNSESISSKKITTGTSSLAFSRAFLKTSRILCSVSPDVLVEQLRALHVEEVGRSWPCRCLPRCSWRGCSRRPWRSASCRSREGRRAGCPSAASACAPRRRPGRCTAARSSRAGSRSARPAHRCRSYVTSGISSSTTSSTADFGIFSNANWVRESYRIVVTRLFSRSRGAAAPRG